MRLSKSSACAKLLAGSADLLTQIVIEAWRREYNEDRPKQGRGGSTPVQYARRLVTERSTLTPGL